MKRLTAIVLAFLAAFTASACATPAPSRYSYTPQTQVTVRNAKKKDVQANYRVSPEESRHGSGGGAQP